MNIDLVQVRDDIRTRKTTARATVDQTLARIARSNSQLNAYHEVFDDQARADADRIDLEIAAGTTFL